MERGLKKTVQVFASKSDRKSMEWSALIIALGILYAISGPRSRDLVLSALVTDPASTRSTRRVID